MQSAFALLLTFGLMYMLLIRPQQRRMRQLQAVVASVRPGDEVVTAGGVYGTVTAVDEETMMLEVAPGIELCVLRSAISKRVASAEERAAADEADEPDEAGEAGDEAGDRGDDDEAASEGGVASSIPVREDD